MLIRLGYADAVVTGGTEAAITPMSLAGLLHLKALSRRNDAPERASRPFDADRDGFVIGEGAGHRCCVEELEHAQGARCHILAEIIGVGVTGDAYHMTVAGARRRGRGARDADGARRRRHRARPRSTTSTRTAPAPSSTTPAKPRPSSRCSATTRTNSLVSSTKSMVGHLLGAAAAVERSSACWRSSDDIIPPTINQEHPDPAVRPRLRAQRARAGSASTWRCRTRSASAGTTPP